MPAPTDFPDWATDEVNNVEPPDAKQALGWVAGEEPPSSWFNWWQNLVGLWIRWFATFEALIATRASDVDMRKLAALNLTARAPGSSVTDDFLAACFGFSLGGGNGARTWVVVGENDKIQWSTTDGTTWAAASGTTAAGNFTSVAYGNGVFVAVGRSDSSGSATPIIYSSTDGQTWTARTPGGAPGAGEWLNGVTWGGGAFVAVGMNGHIQFSTDGVGWVKNIPAAATDDFLAVTYAGAFVAVGSNGSGRGVSEHSSDGSTWFQTLFPVTVQSVACVASNTGDDGGYVAVGNLVADPDTSVVYSGPNGDTWALETTYADSFTYGITALGTLFVMCMDADLPGFGVAPALVAGERGGPWSMVPTPYTSSLFGLASNGFKLLAVGNGGQIADSLTGVP